MAILIDDPEVDRVVNELAARTGETPAEAVRKAAQERLERLPRGPGRVDREKLAQALAYFDSLPRPHAHLTADEITGYNEHGHFD